MWTLAQGSSLRERKVCECVAVRRPGRVETAETRNEGLLWAREVWKRVLRSNFVCQSFTFFTRSGQNPIFFAHDWPPGADKALIDVPVNIRRWRLYGENSTNLPRVPWHELHAIVGPKRHIEASATVARDEKMKPYMSRAAACGEKTAL